MIIDQLKTLNKDYEKLSDKVFSLIKTDTEKTMSIQALEKDTSRLENITENLSKILTDLKTELQSDRKVIKVMVLMLTIASPVLMTILQVLCKHFNYL